MTVADHVSWQGVEVMHTWKSGTELPARLPIRQVSGVCFTETGKIVLVSENERHWNLPGGHPEGLEKPEQTLTREVLEEACAEVLACRLIGWQRVDDPREPAYLQLRYVALVQLLDFRPEFEMLHRLLVSPQDLLSALSWGHSSIAKVLLSEALRVQTQLP